MLREESYTKAFVVRFWVRYMVGWLMSAGRSSMGGVSPAAIATLWSIISKDFQAVVEPQPYANRFVDRLVIGRSDGIGGIWRFGVCVPTPLTVKWTLCQAQSTSSRLQHGDGGTKAVNGLLKRWELWAWSLGDQASG